MASGKTGGTALPWNMGLPMDTDVTPGLDGWEAMDLLRRLDAAFGQVASLSSAAQIAVSEVCSFFGWPVGRAWIEGARERERLGSPNCWHLRDPLRFESFYSVTEAEFFRNQGCLPGEALRTGAAVWVDDLSGPEFFSRGSAARQAGLVGGVALPLLHRGGERTVLEFFFDLPEPAPAAPLAVLGQVAALLERTAERLNLRRRLRIAETNHEILGRIMDLSAQNLPLDDILGRSLAMILAHQSFGMEPQGAIFLARGEELVLVAQRGLAPEAREGCRRVPFGRCICGRVAACRDILHVPAIDRLHDIQHPGMRPHGHFCLPIQRGSRLLGVMNLYLPEGLDRKAVAEEFVVAAANALALAIADHEMDAGLAEAKDQAEAANLAKTRFLQHMSHELRTPLNAIIGFSDMMAGQMLGPLGSEGYIGYAEDIGRAGRHLLQVIGDILDIADLESGAFRFKEGLVDLNDLARECRRTFQEGRALALELNLQRRLPCLKGDGGRILQVLCNLVENALDHTPPGGIISVATGMDDRRGLYLQVSDTGTGMTPEQIAQAAEPFGLVGDLFTRDRDGTGLGLPLSRRFMQMHDGDLLLESRPGLGTVATALFPPERTVDACPPGRCAMAAPAVTGPGKMLRFDGLPLGLGDGLPQSAIKPRAG